MSEDTYDGYGLLASTTYSTIEQKPLTIEDLQRAFDWLKSKEYAEQEREQARRETAGYILVEKAREQGIITDTEAFYLSSSVAMNGGLIVSPTMAERLKQVKS